MREKCLGENQLVPYGYSIFTYMNQYDEAWRQAVQQLRNFLNLQQAAVARTSFMQTKSPLQGHVARNYFPDESIYSVMSYLDDVELCVVCIVSRSWNELSNRDELWNNLLQKHFSVSASDIVLKPRRKKCSGKHISSKVIYKEMYQTLRGVLEGLQGPKMRQPVVSAALLNYSMTM